MTRHEILHSISVAAGNALSHTGSILAGVPMVWADESQRPDLWEHHQRVRRLRRLIADAPL